MDIVTPSGIENCCFGLACCGWIQW